MSKEHIKKLCEIPSHVWKSGFNNHGIPIPASPTISAFVSTFFKVNILDFFPPPPPDTSPSDILTLPSGDGITLGILSGLSKKQIVDFAKANCISVPSNSSKSEILVMFIRACRKYPTWERDLDELVRNKNVFINDPKSGCPKEEYLHHMAGKYMEWFKLEDIFDRYLSMLETNNSRLQFKKSRQFQLVFHIALIMNWMLYNEKLSIKKYGDNHAKSRKHKEKTCTSLTDHLEELAHHFMSAESRGKDCSNYDFIELLRNRMY